MRSHERALGMGDMKADEAEDVIRSHHGAAARAVPDPDLPHVRAPDGLRQRRRGEPLCQRSGERLCVHRHGPQPATRQLNARRGPRPSTG